MPIKKTKTPVHNAWQKARGYEVQKQSASELRQGTHRKQVKAKIAVRNAAAKAKPDGRAIAVAVKAKRVFAVKGHTNKDGTKELRSVYRPRRG